MSKRRCIDVLCWSEFEKLKPNWPKCGSYSLRCQKHFPRPSNHFIGALEWNQSCHTVDRRLESGGHSYLRQRRHARFDSVECFVSWCGLRAGHFDEGEGLQGSLKNIWPGWGLRVFSERVKHGNLSVLRCFHCVHALPCCGWTLLQTRSYALGSSCCGGDDGDFALPLSFALK